MVFTPFTTIPTVVPPTTGVSVYNFQTNEYTFVRASQTMGTLVVVRTGVTSTSGSVNIAFAPSTRYDPSSLAYGEYKTLVEFAPGETSKSVMFPIRDGGDLEYLTAALTDPFPANSDIGSENQAHIALVSSQDISSPFYPAVAGQTYARCLVTDANGMEYTLYLPIATTDLPTDPTDPTDPNTGTFESTDGVTVATADGITTIGFAPGALAQQIPISDGTVYLPGNITAAFPPGTVDGDTFYYDLTAGEWVVGQPPGGGTGVTSADFVATDGVTIADSPDGRVIVGFAPGTIDGQVPTWDTASGTYIAGDPTTTGNFTNASLLPADGITVLANDDGTATIGFAPGTITGQVPSWNADTAVYEPTDLSTVFLTPDSLVPDSGVTITPNDDGTTTIGLTPGTNAGDTLVWNPESGVYEPGTATGFTPENLLPTDGITVVDNGDGTATIGFAPGTEAGQVPVWNPETGVYEPGVGSTFTNASLLSIDGVTVTPNDDGTATIGFAPGTNIGDIPVWDGTQYVATVPTFYLSPDSLIPADGVTTTDNGDGTVTIGFAPGSTTGDIPVWNADLGIYEPGQSTTFSPATSLIPADGVTVLDNGDGTATIGFVPGTNVGDIPTWDGTQYVATPNTSLTAASLLPADGVTVLDNGDGTATIGFAPGSVSGEIPSWNAETGAYEPTDLSTTFLTPSSLLPLDGVTTTDNGDGTVSIGFAPGTIDGQVPLWNTLTSAYEPGAIPVFTPASLIPTDGLTVLDNGDGTATLGFATGTTEGQIPVWNASTSQYEPGEIDLDGGIV